MTFTPSDGSKEHIDFETKTAQVVRKTVADFWALILAGMIIFGWILQEIYSHHGRISALESKIESLYKD